MFTDRSDKTAILSLTVLFMFLCTFQVPEINRGFSIFILSKKLVENLIRGSVLKKKLDVLIIRISFHFVICCLLIEHGSFVEKEIEAFNSSQYAAMPALVLVKDGKEYLISRGYMNFESVEGKLDSFLF